MASKNIPKNLNDCFVHLKTLLGTAEVRKIETSSEKSMNTYHFGLGMHIRNEWGLWQGSKLAQWFNTQGIHHADDMSGIILNSFWRHLHDHPIDLDKQVKFYQDYWKKQKETDHESK